jgi:polar amino acid transport system substrate-binding protein
MSKIRFLIYYLKAFYLAIAFGFFPPSFPVNAAEWEEIISRGKLIVGVKNNLRPLGYQDSEGNLQGFEIDIARRLAKELLGDANAIELVPISNSQRLQMVIDDRVDLAIASVTVTSSRQRVVDFSPYYYFDTIAIITKNNQLRPFSNINIAVLHNSGTIEELKVSLPQANLRGVASYQEALSLLENGEADGLAGDLTILSGWVQQYPQYFILPQRWSGYPLAVVMPKGLQYQELREKVSEAIAQWRKDGWLEERAKFWGLDWFKKYD